LPAAVYANFLGPDVSAAPGIDRKCQCQCQRKKIQLLGPTIRGPTSETARSPKDSFLLLTLTLTLLVFLVELADNHFVLQFNH
jgi:hypothetical protein